MALLLGIDLGTSSIKVILFDPDTAQTVAIANEEYRLSKPKPDWAEQNPDDWWQVTIRATRRALAAAGRDDVAAIGFSGHMHGATLIDAAQRPVRPAIIWADQRSAAQVDALINAIGADRYAQLCGTLPAAGFTAPTLLWLAQHEPQALKAAHYVLFAKDYLRLCMTDEVATEVSDAAGSGMFEVAAGRWAVDVVSAAQCRPELLPVVKQSSDIGGTLTQAAAQELGLRAGIPVTMGCADQPAQAVGNGIIALGLASVTIGSGGQVLVPIMPAADQPLRTDARLHVFNHAVPHTYYVMGAILSAGLSLRWLRNMLGMADDPNAYAILSREAAAVPAGAGGLIFLPHLTGERTPYMDAHARGAFIGLTAAHERGHLARAVMEGVAFTLRQALEISQSLGGVAERILGAGGAMDSDVWRGIVTDVIGLPLQKPLLTEQAGVGAALVAGVGVGIYNDFADACSRVVRYSDPSLPNATRVAFYNERYEQFITLYPKLKADFHQLRH